jgi:hypothetical protein
LSDEVRRDKLLPLFKKLYEEAWINTFNCRDRCIVSWSNFNKQAWDAFLGMHTDSYLGVVKTCREKKDSKQ